MSRIGKISLENYKIISGSLLARCIESLPSDMQRGTFITMKSVLLHTLTNDEARNVFSSKPCEVTTEQLYLIFTIGENYIEALGITKNGPYSIRFRRLFSFCSDKLANRDTVNTASATFKSRFKKKNNGADIDNSLMKKCSDQIRTTPFENLDELNEKVQEQYNRIIEKIISACEKDIDTHILYCEKIRNFKKTPIPHNEQIEQILKERYLIGNSRLIKEYFNHANVDEILHINCRCAEHKQFHKKDGWNEIEE